MLRAILNESWKHPPQLYGHLPPISKTIKLKRKRHAVKYWRSKDELISDVLLWILHMNVPVLTDQLCSDTGCHLEDLLGTVNDRDGWRESERERERESGKSVLSVRLDDDDKTFCE